MNINTTKPSGLLWQPLHEEIASRCASGDPLLLVVSPYVKEDALDRLLEESGYTEDLKVVVRWRPEDLLAGVSDLSIYPFLKARGIPLYANARLHLKLYVCSSNWALSTSANLTRRGLGYAGPTSWNEESGCSVALSRQDWIPLYRIIHDSRLVTDEVHARLSAYVEKYGERQPSMPEIDPFDLPKVFTLASLPATYHPQQLEDFYFAAGDQGLSPELTRRAFKDLAVFKLPLGLTRSEFRDALQQAFLDSEFVRAFLRHLVSVGSLRFGSVTTWIQENCEDTPLPYRAEIKQQVSILYDWLMALVPGVTWDRPSHSQVIYWQEPD